MKKLFFFDIDGTLRSNKNKVILAQTQKLILELSKQPDVVLGIATGRSYGRLGVLPQEIRPLFKHLVLCNGALVINDNHIINEICYSQEDIEQVQNQIEKIGVEMTLFAWDKIFTVASKSTNIPRHNSDFKNANIIVLDDSFYKNNKIYQMVLLHKNEEQKRQIKIIIEQMPNLKAYFWDGGFVDLLYKKIDKSYGINQIQKLYEKHQLICMGDGPNDFEMLKLADVSIAMGNTKIEALKQVSRFISPHIDEDHMYDFFQKIKLI